MWEPPGGENLEEWRRQGRTHQPPAADLEAGQKSSDCSSAEGSRLMTTVSRPSFGRYELSLPTCEVTWTANSKGLGNEIGDDGWLTSTHQPVAPVPWGPTHPSQGRVHCPNRRRRWRRRRKTHGDVTEGMDGRFFGRRREARGVSPLRKNAAGLCGLLVRSIHGCFSF